MPRCTASSLPEPVGRHPAAAFALELFAYRVATAVGAMVVALGGLDALVFTAGIGEHSARVRREVAAHLVQCRGERHVAQYLDRAAPRGLEHIGRQGHTWFDRADDRPIAERPNEDDRDAPLPRRRLRGRPE